MIKIDSKPGRYPARARGGETYRPPVRGGYKVKGPGVKDLPAYEACAAAMLAGEIHGFRYYAGPKGAGRFALEYVDPTTPATPITRDEIAARWGDGTAALSDQWERRFGGRKVPREVADAIAADNAARSRERRAMLAALDPAPAEPGFEPEVWADVLRAELEAVWRTPAVPEVPEITAPEPVRIEHGQWVCVIDDTAGADWSDCSSHEHEFQAVAS